MSDEEGKRTLQPHHDQQPLCTTRLPYRQGRELTAVKVYTINTESNHLLVFGVPSLNLRQEARALFGRFGTLLQFHVTDHPGELFTETYHARFDRIQSARIAKRKLDAKSFYGGTLHVSYAPELEDLSETRKKLMQRRKDVTYRLSNLVRERDSVKEVDIPIAIEKPESYNLIENEVTVKVVEKLNMGVENVVYLKHKPEDRKRKKFKSGSQIDVVDCTSTEKTTISNIDEALNYQKFGNEVIRQVDNKPMNVIKFNIKKR